MTSLPYPASLWRRLAAAVYDLFLLLAVWFISVLALLPFTDGQAPPGDSWWFRAYVLFVAYLFFGWFWTHGGQTLGMKAWRLRLRRTDGGPAGWGQALIRYLAAWPAWLSVIGILWILFDPQRRGWQDMLSGTEIVVDEAPGAPRPAPRAPRPARHGYRAADALFLPGAGRRARGAS